MTRQHRENPGKTRNVQATPGKLRNQGEIKQDQIPRAGSTTSNSAYQRSHRPSACLSVPSDTTSSKMHRLQTAA